jgi:hypothetical protein
MTKKKGNTHDGRSGRSHSQVSQNQRDLGHPAFIAAKPPAKAKAPEHRSGGFEILEHRLPDTLNDMRNILLVKHVSKCRVTRGGQGSRTLVAAKNHSTVWQTASSTHWQYPPKRPFTALHSMIAIA